MDACWRRAVNFQLIVLFSLWVLSVLCGLPVSFLLRASVVFSLLWFFLSGAFPTMDAQQSALPHLPTRRPDAHKGDFGLALVVGGSRGMAGAAALAGMAALRGGAGLVRLAVPDTILETVAGFEPSYMTVPLPADAAGRIAGAPSTRSPSWRRRPRPSPAVPASAAPSTSINSSCGCIRRSPSR